MKGICVYKGMASTRFSRRALNYHKEGREVWENPVKDNDDNKHNTKTVQTVFTVINILTA